MKPAYIYGAIFLITALCASLAYASVSTFSAYQHAKKQSSDLRFVSSTSGIFRYGVVAAIDPSTRTLNVALQRFQGDNVQVRVRVPDGAKIARQELRSTDGIYTSLPEESPAAFSDITVGTRVAMFIIRTGESIETPIILFGNPI